MTTTMKKNRASKTPVKSVVFDYRPLARTERLPAALLRSLEAEAAREFPNDPMLTELHVLRAVKAWRRERDRG